MFEMVTNFCFCDVAVNDRWTGKNTLVGIFEHFKFEGFPAVSTVFAAYARVADVLGYYAFNFQLVSPDGEVLAKVGTIEGRFPTLQPLELSFNGVQVTFKKPGLHEGRLICKGEVIATLGMMVFQKRPGE